MLPSVDHCRNWLQQLQLTLLEATKDDFYPGRALSKRIASVQRTAGNFLCGRRVSCCSSRRSLPCAAKLPPWSSQQWLLGLTLQLCSFGFSQLAVRGGSEISQPATIRPADVFFLPPFISNILPLTWCLLQQHSTKTLYFSARLYKCPISGLRNNPSWRVSGYHRSESFPFWGSQVWRCLD